jgi:RES domain-containing protein
MLVYRIVHKLYSKNLFASGAAGRWSSAGNKAIYTAESIPLAFLENMIRRQGIGFNKDFKIMFIEIPDTTQMANINVPQLEEGWRDFHDYSKCQPMGDVWYNEGKALTLKIPSAILPESYNYVINSEHADYKLVKLIATTDLVPDERIEDILKKYPKQ